MPSLEAVAVAMWNCLCIRTPQPDLSDSTSAYL